MTPVDEIEVSRVVASCKNKLSTDANELSMYIIKQQWLSQEAMEIADERRKANNMQDNDEWRRKDKLLTRKANEDNNIYLEDMWLELERSGSDSRRVFQFLKKITHKRTALMDVINDKEGKALTQDDEIKKRWAEYCEDLYKKPKMIIPIFITRGKKVSHPHSEMKSDRH